MRVKSVLTHSTARTALGAVTIWLVLAYLHLMAGYLDAVSYRPEHRLSINDYAYYFMAYLCWAIFSIVLLEILQRQSEDKRRIRFIVVYLLGLVVWLPSYFVLDFLINALINQAGFQGIIDKLISTPNALLFFYAMLYSLTFGVCISIVFYKETKKVKFDALKMSQQHTEAQLKMTSQHLQLLQSQLGPHFLFNCLGAISGLARTADKEALLSAVSSVGNLLRFSVDSSKFDRILLSEELDFVNDYIALQTLRFPERFHYRMQLDVDDINPLVPPFLIQPLIENVFTHAVANSATPIEINLRISIQRTQLCILVSNTHVLTDTQSKGMQTSLSNLIERLHATYGDQAQFMHRIDNGHYASEIRLPIDNLKMRVGPHD